MATARTFLAWFEYLDVKGRELTMEELQALLLCQIREYARVTLELQQQQKDATEHIEGMLGSLDELLAGTNDLYAALAARRGRPSPVLPGREGP